MTTITTIILITSIILSVATHKEVNCEINNQKIEMLKEFKKEKPEQTMKEKDEKNVQKTK